jgi:hypothetical protein
MIRKTSVFALLIFALVPVTALAQFQNWTPPPLSTIGYVNATVYGDTWARENRRAARESYEPRRVQPLATPRPMQRAAPTASPTRLNFIPSLARRRGTMEKIVRDYVQLNPASAAEIRAQLISNGDFIEQIAGAIEPYGYRTTNLADAYAIFWISAWEASHGITNAQTQRSQAQAVKRQVESILVAIPQAAEASDADKQAFAELLLVQAVMVQSAAEQNANNPTRRPQFEASVRQIATSLGFDLDLFTLTPTGFELASGR